MNRNIYLILLLSIIFWTGCVSKDKDVNELNNSEILDVGAVDKEILNTSEKIADSVVELYGIDNSTALVFNENVLVGVILASKQEMTEDMIESINNIIKDNNPHINNVLISVDKKNFRDIDNIVMNLLDGESYDNYVDEINIIMERINKEK